MYNYWTFLYEGVDKGEGECDNRAIEQYKYENKCQISFKISDYF